MGIDTDLFVSPPPPDLVCVICSDVLEDPVALDCEHAFCRDCITAALRRASNCPVCRRSCDAASLKPCARMVRNLINHLQVRCRNHAKGCPHQGELDQLAVHLNTACRFGIVKCPNEGCELQLDPDQLAQHATSCDWRLIACTNVGCSERRAARDMRGHQRQCEHRVEPCALGCGSVLKAVRMSEHLDHSCPKQVISCAVEGCGFEAERGDEQGWLAHNQNADHVALLSRTARALREHVEGQDRRLDAQAREIAQLKARLQVLGALEAFAFEHAFNCKGPNHRLWVVHGFEEKRCSAERVVSEELRFDAQNPAHRYSFQLACQTSGPNGPVSIQFVPRRGPGFASLQWPFARNVVLAVLNHANGDAVQLLLQPRGPAREFFAKHAPPSHDNQEAIGFSLQAVQLDSGPFVRHGCVVVRATLV